MFTVPLHWCAVAHHNPGVVKQLFHCQTPLWVHLQVKEINRDEIALSLKTHWNTAQIMYVPASSGSEVECFQVKASSGDCIFLSFNIQAYNVDLTQNKTLLSVSRQMGTKFNTYWTNRLVKKNDKYIKIYIKLHLYLIW